MKKHAYLIMAHHQFEILMIFLRLMDHERNDFYIHIDIKTKDIPIEKIRNSVKYSRIEFINRMSVNWGGYSQIECELNLLKQALQGEYDYYHLVSGIDMPIKTKNKILDYFENKENTQYVHFEQKQIQDKYLDRIRYWYPFQEKVKKGYIYYLMGQVLLKIQKLFGVNRIKIENEFQFGANWFSITHEFAQYVVSQEKWIKKRFSMTTCADEIFLQTVLINSPFKNELPREAFEGDYSSCLRHIDWKRGNPYIFRKSDFEELISAKELFARKFDWNIDKEIIYQLKNYLEKEGEYETNEKDSSVDTMLQ